MHFVQRAFIYNKAEFRFQEKNLDVVIDDGRLKIGFSAPYHEISAKRSMRSFSEKAFIYSALATLLALAAVYASTLGDIMNTDSPLFMCLAAVGAILLVVSKYVKFEATQIPVASGNTILIFHDDKLPVIVNEIMKRRKSEILRLYGEVDVLNDPKLELKKFSWLKEEGILSQESFEEARLKLAMVSRKHSGHS